MNANRNFNKNASSNNSSRNNSSKKPFCKVCHDAGKPESVYTSHCVKTYNIKTGKTDTTCPTLMALECRYCWKLGHTVKFCPVLEENKKMDVERARDRARHEYQARQEQQQAAVQAQNKPKNAFAAFAEEQEEEEREVQELQAKQELQVKQELQAKEDFPALMGNTRVAQNSNAKSYSCVASTPADERRLEMSRQQRVQQAAQVEAQKKAVSWADEDDSEDEEYESEEEDVKVVVVSQAGSSAYFQPSASYIYAARATADDDDW